MGKDPPTVYLGFRFKADPNPVIAWGVRWMGIKFTQACSPITCAPTQGEKGPLLFLLPRACSWLLGMMFRQVTP